MSRSARVSVFFGDDDHDFALLIGQCVELQEKLDCGLMPTLERVQQIDVKAIREVLRLGLIGGGMGKEEAVRLVARHLTAGELGACAAKAAQVVAAAVAGAEDEPPGEAAGEAARSAPASPRSPEARSDTASSTAPPPPWAGHLATSTDAPTGSCPPPSPDTSGRKAARTRRPARPAKTSTTPS